MSEPSHNTLRLLFDLQACQTSNSANRGVARYTKALFEEIASMASPREIFTLTSTQLPHAYDPPCVNPSKSLELPKSPDWYSNNIVHQLGDQDIFDGLTAASFAQSIKPDVIHIAHVFEGFDERVGLFDPLQRASGQIISATLYDLIPLQFQQHYFENSKFRRWYFSRLAWLRKADLLLAISESTRQDAINLLGIEPSRIVTIYGGISSHFTPPKDPKLARYRLKQRFDLRERIVLYTGGDDHRKNIKGAIRGFSKIPLEIRTNTQLVVICSMMPERKKIYQDEAKACGLKPSDILITGFISEQDLIDFYGICDVFVFPSLYEGLGLPALEAMACGAPVIGGNNSSIRELIVREDALFDATNDESIAACIIKVLCDKHFSKELQCYGITRAAEFNWKRSAKLALNAFDDAVSRARHAGIQSARNGWLPRKRLAILTPLPPLRSGIADFNAQFLPFLARYFYIDLYVENHTVTDETLLSLFRIFNVKNFEHVATSYDLILYEIGNSEFHAHMLPLLEKFPGVVGLHDAYLSGLFGYLDFNKGAIQSYQREMLASHGSSARHYFAPVQANPEPNGNSMANLPCTKRILNLALGVISHSPFNLNIARLHYPEGWQAPYRTIPQMVKLPYKIDTNERDIIRSKLGFQENDFVLTTFGHIVWTKCGDCLLDAFLNSFLSKNNIYLVFAGMLAEDDFGKNLQQAIKNANLKNRIRVTGYLSEEDYARYLQATDCAIQLRTKSRGGTPKSVLDCLAYGVPVIVNNDASYTDYPDDVVIKLTPHPTAPIISEKLESLFKNPHQLTEYASRGRAYVAKYHDPNQSAAMYASALHEFWSHEQTCKIDTWVNTFAPLIATTSPKSENAAPIAKWLAKIKTPTWHRRRLYIDVSHIAEYDHNTGIQRVVKETIKSLYTGPFHGFDVIAVELKNGCLFEALSWCAGKGFLAPSEVQSDPKKIVFSKGDVLLMLDSSWARYTEFLPVFQQARLVNVPVITAVYDILPLILPAGNFVLGGQQWFQQWFHKAIYTSDMLLCISRTVANDVTAYIKNNFPKLAPPKIGYWHLGSNFEKNPSPNQCPELPIHDQLSPYLLTVGTIEPRKSHALLLDAMELLWAKGVKLNLCIAGKEGWMVDQLISRLRNHPELGKRLFLIENPSDKGISALYQHASALILLSIGEGFGLPLVEAAHYGTPIICSDIPVFREIAMEFATYVKLDSPQLVSEGILQWLDSKNNGLLPDTRMMPRLTWGESAEQMLKVIFHENWLWRQQ